ncbi:MAG: sensor histidine kinase, partial [Bianqueaceae bacterium]
LINYKDRFSYILSAHLIIMSFLMVLSILYFSKAATYQIFFNMDYDLYLWLQQARLPLNTIVKLRNIAIAAFLFISASYVCLWKCTKWYYFCILLIPLLLLVIRNHPEIVWKIFIYHQTANPANRLSAAIVNFLDSFLMHAILYVYLLIPFISLILNYRHTSVILKKNKLKLYGICIGVINLFFFATFINGMFSKILFYNTNEALLPKERIVSTSFTWITQIIYLFLFLFAGIILLLNRKSSYVLMKRHDIFLNSRTLEKNCNMIFHVYKNAFLGIKRQTALMQRSLADSDYKKTEGHIQLCQSIAEAHLEMVNKTVFFLSDANLSPGPVKISECIRHAVETTPMPDNIQTFYAFPQNEPYVNADEYHLTEVFKNIIANAVSALHKKGHSDPSITFKGTYETDYGIIEITDNGVGISQDKIKNIFSIFYSANFEPHSSGIGLYYAKKVITQMQGEIRVESQPGSFSKFKVALPLYIIH